MIRDIRALHPDIVISLSGTNNLRIRNKKFDQMRGEDPFEYRRRVEWYMKQIAESEGASCFAILQPVNQSPDVKTLYEAFLYHKQAHWRAAQFSKSHRADDFYHDLFTLFLHQNDKMIDMCHYSDAGNAELAREI